jgi:hypothetical protein
MQTKLKPLWRCPKCGARFVTKSMWHSCGRFTLKELFAHSDPNVLRLFKEFERLVRSLGPVRMIPQKTRVVFQVRVRFAGAYPRKSYLLCGFALTRRITHPRLVKYEYYGPNWHGHLFRIESEDQFDDKFRQWVKEAYAVGEQRYLRK